MPGFDDLANNLRQRAESIVVNLNGRKKFVARAIDSLIVKAMPVDTGRAKSSVVVTVGEPSLIETKEAYFPGKKRSTEGENIRAAISQGEAAIDTAQPGEEIHININLPYITHLNKGSSPQADPGFIEESIRQAASLDPDISILSIQRKR
jgi:hypothetical protein